MNPLSVTGECSFVFLHNLRPSEKKCKCSDLEKPRSLEIANTGGGSVESWYANCEEKDSHTCCPRAVQRQNSRLEFVQNNHGRIRIVNHMEIIDLYLRLLKSSKFYLNTSSVQDVAWTTQGSPRISNATREAGAGVRQSPVAL